MRLLVVDDDKLVLPMLEKFLVSGGYVCDLADSGSRALELAEQNHYEAVVLDLSLPDIDGLEVCDRLRANGFWAPILMLTGRSSIEDRVAGLDAGADDYLCKPFASEELLARVRALVRRSPHERPAQLVVGDLSLDPADHVVMRGDHAVHLTPKEFALLELLMRRAGEAVSRDEILDSIWGYRYGAKTVDVYISYLRDKVDRPFGAATIRSVRGLGYMVTERASAAL